MDTKVKAVAGLLSMMVLGYTACHVANQYAAIRSEELSVKRLAAQPKAHDYRIVKLDGQVMRVDEATGETHYWSDDGGGWVQIADTPLQSAISGRERQQRKAVLDAWYDAIRESGSPAMSYDDLVAVTDGYPAEQLQDYFNAWKRKQDTAKRQAIIQQWYAIMTPDYQAAMSYEDFEAKLIGDSQDALRRGFELVKQKQAAAAMNPPSVVQAQDVVANSTTSPTAMVAQASPAQAAPQRMRCPVGGESYSPLVTVCPTHNVTLVAE